jgi:alpha-tubulin suppressor-like RCC1 family protein
MFPGMNPAGLKVRIRRALRSARGAFDLPSILVGVVVVGILTAGVLAAVFAVIPFAQDNGAKQDLAAARTAEGVAKAKDGKYMAAGALQTAGYLPAHQDLAVGADTEGSCWVGVARSGSGTVFYATTATPEPRPWTTGTDTGCLDAAAQATLRDSVTGTISPPATAPAKNPSLAAWGGNTLGQFGNGTTSGSTTPVNVPLIGVLKDKKITALSAGYAHTCAIADGSAYCWGQGGSGQLGNGGTADSSVPVAVSGVLAGRTVTAISTGDAYTCAISDAKAYCWGHNGSSKLGIGVNGGIIALPAEVLTTSGMSGQVTSIAAGYEHTCAVAGGEAFCWGYNNFGELGGKQASKALVSIPAAVYSSGVLKGLTIQSVSVGTFHSCALAAGRVFCWGSDALGELGTGAVITPGVPMAVERLDGRTVSQLSGYNRSNCVLADGKVFCWGSNAKGQLGIGSTGTVADLPTLVDSSSALVGKTATQISVGYTHACAVADEAVYCWGENGAGQVGNGTTSDALSPAAINTGPLAGKRVVAISASIRYGYTMALYSD